MNRLTPDEANEIRPTSQPSVSPVVPAAHEVAQPWLRQVVLFLTGQSLSLFGSAVVGYAVIWYITLKTGSGWQYALLMICSQLAMAITTIPGGIWADRYWRKALMIGADAIVAVVTLVLAVFMLNGFESLWLIAAALALRGLAGGVQQPAVNAVLPQIAPADHLLRINSINQALQAIIQVAAPALAAVFLAFMPLGAILLIDVTTALIGVGVTLFVRIPRLSLDPDTPQPEGVIGYFSHLGEALAYAWAIPGLKRAMIVCGILLTVVIPYSQMTPVFVVRLYGPAQWMLASVEIAFSIGMVVGGIAMAAWGGTRNRMTMVMIACGIMAATTVVMGFMPSIWWFIVIMVVMGLSLPMLNTPLITAIQERIPATMMGRVMSIVTLMSVVCGPLGMAIAGPLADRLDLSWMALVCGLVGLVVVVGLAIKGGPGSKLYPVEAGETGATGTTSAVG